MAKYNGPLLCSFSMAENQTNENRHSTKSRIYRRDGCYVLCKHFFLWAIKNSLAGGCWNSSEFWDDKVVAETVTDIPTQVPVHTDWYYARLSLLICVAFSMTGSDEFATARKLLTDFPDFFRVKEQGQVISQNRSFHEETLGKMCLIWYLLKERQDKRPLSLYQCFDAFIRETLMGCSGSS